MRSMFFLLSLVILSPAYSAVSQFEIKAVQIKSNTIEQTSPSFCFQLHHGNLKENYQLSILNVEGKEEILHPKLNLTKNGILAEKDGTPFTLCPLSMGLGEPLYFICKNKSQTAQCLIIPRPLCFSQNGYILNLQLKDPEYKTFIVNAKGFDPGEKIRFYSKSGDKIIHNKLTANHLGEIEGTLIHTSPNKKKGGKAYIEVLGSKGKISLDYPWGIEHEREMRMNNQREKALFFAKYK